MRPSTGENCHEFVSFSPSIDISTVAYMLLILVFFGRGSVFPTYFWSMSLRKKTGQFQRFFSWQGKKEKNYVFNLKMMINCEGFSVIDILCSYVFPHHIFFRIFGRKTPICFFRKKKILPLELCCVGEGRVMIMITTVILVLTSKRISDPQNFPMYRTT